MTGAVLAALIAVPGGLLVPAQGWSQAIEEIVVTARKKTESLQHVPLSISAFSADMIRERNIQNAYDIAKFTPNFKLSRNLGRRLDRPDPMSQRPTKELLFVEQVVETILLC